MLPEQNMMQFKKTEDVISFIRQAVTAEELAAFKNKPFTTTFGVQAHVVRKYAIAIGIEQFDRDLLRDIYEFFDRIGYGTTMNWMDAEEQVTADPEMAINVIFLYLYHEWHGKNPHFQNIK